MDSMWVDCVNLGHNAMIIMILLFLFGARYHYHHDIIGAQWGNLMIPLYDITVFQFLGGFFPRRGPRVTPADFTCRSTSGQDINTSRCEKPSTACLMFRVCGFADRILSGFRISKTVMLDLGPKNYIF